MNTITTASDVIELQGINLSLDHYDHLISCIHDGALDAQRLYEAVEQLRRLFSANYATLILRIPGVENIALMLVAGEVEGSGTVRYFDYFHNDSPFSHMPADASFTIDDVMSQSEWEANAYYTDYAKNNDVYHILGADITTRKTGCCVFASHVVITSRPSTPATRLCATGCCRICAALSMFTTCWGAASH